ncbi:hypothetical protein CWC20_16085, partial [Pseudoalteromonas aurantia]
PWIDQIADEPQWSSRIFIRRFITYFKISKKEELQLFIRVLKGFANRLPFSDKPRFEDLDIALSLFAISNGCLRKLKNFLDSALTEALISDAQQACLSSAFKAWRPELDNVFEMNVNEIQGCEVEQYSTFKPDGPQGEDPFINPQFCKKVPLVQLLKK